MIKSFRGKGIEDIYNGEISRYALKIPLELHNKIRRLLDQINAAHNIADLRIPPGNNLEALHGDLLHFWSIRVNRQYRIMFQWESGNAYEVEVLDYH